MSLSLLGTAALAADASKPSPFPDLPYAKRWVFSPGAATKPSRPADGRTALRYNPICVNPDLPCNGDPSDYYNEGSGWDLLVDTVVKQDRVEVFGRSQGGNSRPVNEAHVVCVGYDCREYLLDLKTIYESSSGSVKMALRDLFRSPELIQKCMPYAHVLPPDSLAKSVEVMKTAPAFFQANDVSVIGGDTFDVQQIDGKVFRFQVSLSYPSGGIRDVAYVGPVNIGTASPCR